MDWFERWARDRPDAPYLIAGADSVTFAEAAERIRAIAGGIRARFAIGARIGVVAHPSAETALTLMAVPYAGAILVPIPVDSRAPERAVIAEEAGLDLVVDGSPPVGSARLPPPVDEATYAAIRTSGTSGRPRTVRLTWHNIEASAAASSLLLDHTPGDRWLAVLPLHHVGGLSILIRSAREGSAVVLDGSFDPSTAVTRMHDGTVTLGSFVGPMLERMLDAGLRAGPSFRHGLVGGGPASGRALAAAGLSLLPTYGMTETASQVATADPADPRPDRLLPLTDVDLAIDEGGRIVVTGPMVSPGALDEPGDDTGTLVTGDLGRLHGRALEVLGRADRVIVTGGENVMPELVERVISGLPGAGEVAVTGIADERWGAVVVAAYTGPADVVALDAAAREALRSHERPRRWRRIGAIPRRGIGKLDEDALRALFD